VRWRCGYVPLPHREHTSRQAIRKLPGLVERSRGAFYRRSRAYLHFHEDPSGMYADVRTGEDFTRHRVQSAAERQVFLALVADATSER
jgi:hypothetical protein